MCPAQIYNIPRRIHQKRCFSLSYQNSKLYTIKFSQNLESNQFEVHFSAGSFWPFQQRRAQGGCLALALNLNCVNNNQMSEIDFKDPFLCQQLALSEKQSPTNQQTAKQFDSGDDCFDLCHKNSNSNMFRSVNSGFRLSQTTDSKRSSPIKINFSLIKSTTNPLGQSTGLIHNSDFKPESPVFLQKIGEEERFECQHDLQSNQSCPLCKGAGFVKGSNNLIKFFEYLIGFKVGINGPYKQKKLAPHKKTEVNDFCNDFYRNEPKKSNLRTTTSNLRKTGSNFTYRINSRASEKPVPTFRSSLYGECRASERQILNQSERFSTKTARICNRDDVVQQLNALVTIHSNYRCDICGCSPIVGNRYHCRDCQDFDQCEDCHHKEPHPHMMEKIAKTGKSKQLQHVITFLAQPSSKNLRDSLRPPPTIQLGNRSINTARSAVR